MGIFTWNSTFVLGVELIDEQHRILISRIDQLYDHLVTNERSVDFDKVIADIVDYTDFHFRSEEELMARSGYPSLDDHLPEHHKFEANIKNYSKKSDRGDEWKMELFQYLQDWLIDHILDTDKQFASYFLQLDQER
jgi:hemerythrin-like metal-binding protein